MFNKVGNNLFVVEFQATLDLKRVQDGRPWTFDQNLLCLTNYDKSVTLHEIKFKKEPIWVQFHKLSLGMMNQVYGEEFEKIVGDVKDIDVDKDRIGCGSYLKIKTQVDTTKLLVRGSLNNHEGK